MLLKQVRINQGLTQQDVAQAIGAKVRHYQYVEAGESFLSQNKLNKLEDVFKLPQRILLAQSIEEVPEYYRNFIPKIFGTD